MENTDILPIQSKQRTAIVDILRGWALLGVVLMNYVDYYYLGLDWTKLKPDMISNILMSVGQFVFSAKSWTLLSVLFGYGFSVLMTNVAAKGISPNRFFTRRMFWLLMLAVVNSAFFFGDILKDYAVMGMCLLPFRNIKAKKALYISIGLLTIAPVVVSLVNSINHSDGMKLLEPIFPLLSSHNPFKVLWFGLYGTALFEFVNLNYLISVHVIMLSLFFFGMAVHKSGFLIHIHENKKRVGRIMWGSLGAAFVLIILFIITNKMKWTWMNYYAPFYMVIIASMLFIASLLCWFYARGKWKGFFNSMQVIGKMTLTNYMTQNLLALFLFSGIGFGFSLANRIHFGYYMLFALVIYIAQIYFSKWWLSKYQYGPVEWVWRQLSYHKKLPIKKTTGSGETMPVHTNVEISLPGSMLNN